MPNTHEVLKKCLITINTNDQVLAAIRRFAIKKGEIETIDELMKMNRDCRDMLHTKIIETKPTHDPRGDHGQAEAMKHMRSPIESVESVELKK